MLLLSTFCMKRSLPRFLISLTSAKGPNPASASSIFWICRDVKTFSGLSRINVKGASLFTARFPCPALRFLSTGGYEPPPRTKKPTHTPDQACESASGYFSPLSRQSRFVSFPWVKQTTLFLRCLQDALALHFLDEAQLATLFDESDLTKGP
jgi:hypothetical protein